MNVINIIKKAKETQQVFNMVEWESYSIAFWQLSRSQKISKAKLIHQKVNITRQNKLYYGEPDQCPCFNQEEEFFNMLKILIPMFLQPTAPVLVQFWTRIFQNILQVTIMMCWPLLFTSLQFQMLAALYYHDLHHLLSSKEAKKFTIPHFDPSKMPWSSFAIKLLTSISLNVTWHIS
jgi:hypothetical protein